MLPELTQIEYNPANDIIKFITIISLPSIILFISFNFLKRQIKSRKMKTLTKITNGDLSFKSKIVGKKVLLLLSIIFVLIMSLNIPTFRGNTRYVDSFHEGETLGPSISYMTGSLT